MKKWLFISIFIGFAFCSSCTIEDDEPPLQCEEMAEIISPEEFYTLETSGIITSINLTDNCLELTISDSGCDENEWEVNLYSTNAFYTSVPTQREVKVELINNQECLTVLQKTVSFDLTPFQLEGQNHIKLNIEGWDEPVDYYY